MEKNEIFIIYTDHDNLSNSIIEKTIQLAEQSNLADLIGDKNTRIGLKPNIVNAKTANYGSTTHPEIILGLISYLQKNNFKNIAIIEGAWAGANTQEAFKVCGYKKIAEETGVKLIDTQRDKAKMIDCHGMKLEICESAINIDFVINIPVLKGHCQTNLTCALKNNKGLIPDREKRRFHSLGLTKPIAHLNTIIRNDFIIIDGICGDLDFEEGGNPLYAGRLIAARDPVLCDAWAAEQIGYKVSEVSYIGLAEKLGVGSADIKNAKIKELNKSDTALRNTEFYKLTSRKVQQYTQYIIENNACSACYASLIHALSRAERSKLDKLKSKICVGQGFKGKRGSQGGKEYIGIGNCCAEFSVNCPGCPPSGADILEMIGKI